MKKTLGVIVLVVMLISMVGRISLSNRSEEEVKVYSGMIRFHVRANSDSESDQKLKLQVRDAVVAKLSPVLANSSSIEESRQIIKENLQTMQGVAAKVIAAKGKDYPVTARFGYADFPVKSYGAVVYPAGRYEAVQLIIGEGKGANWWCVLFPPLCFVDVTASLEKQKAVPVNSLQQADKPLVVDEEVKPKVKFKFLEIIKSLFHFLLGKR